MVSLPQDLIDEILKNRPVYLVVHHVPCYDFSETTTRGIYFNYENAIRCVLKYAFENLTFNHYDPKKRFYERESHSFYATSTDLEWADEWVRYIGIDDFRIEEWKPEIGLIETKWFNFDDWIKNRIINEELSRDFTKKHLKEWRKDALKGNIPQELLNVFEVKKREIPRGGYVGNREDWVKMYGTQPPYPYTNNCGIERLDSDDEKQTL